MDPESENDIPLSDETEVTEAPESDSEELEVSEAESGETEEGEGELQPEVFEYEADGVKYSVPKALESALMMHKDYTQKTQAVAEERRALEQQREMLNQQASLPQEDMADHGVIQVYGDELASYNDVDWDAWYDQDFMAAQKAATRVQQLRDAVSGAQNRIAQRQQQRSAQTAQDFATRQQETRKYAEQNLKGWSPEIDVKVAEYARSLGFNDQELAAQMSPKTYRLLYNAYLGERLTSQQQREAKKAEVKPVTKVRGRSAPATSGVHDNLSMKEWMARRSKQARA